MTGTGRRKRRVAITGIGAVTPLGRDFEATWNGVCEARVAAGPVDLFPSEKFPTRFAYEARDFELRSDVLVGEESKLLNRAGGFMINASLEAMAQSRWDRAGIAPERRSVCLGVGIGCPEYSWFTSVYLQENWQDPSLRFHRKQFPAAVGTILARIGDAQGGVTTVHTACASSGQSLGEAYEQVAYGDSDLVLTGGADSMINPFHMAGFCLLGALSKRNEEPMQASRPFDRDREGFVLGEGACALVFEEWDNAVKRGASILGEVVGYGVTESAYRITDLHPEGVGPFEAMQMAVQDAGIEARNLGYINAHGTSTQLNDRVEALAIRKLLGESSNCSVSSSKGMTGHLISAAGAIEFAICVRALKEQVLPPSVNVVWQDPTCEITLTPKALTPAKFDFALSNSVGFGGSNTALIAKRVATSVQREGAEQ